MNVFLTGVTGFVGSHMLERLAADGHTVRALVRDPERARAGITRLNGRAAQALAAGTVQFTPGDVVTGAGLEVGVAGCQAVVHLVGIIMQTRGATFEAAHFTGTRNLLAAAKSAGVRRWLQM